MKYLMRYLTHINLSNNRCLRIINMDFIDVNHIEGVVK